MGMFDDLIPTTDAGGGKVSGAESMELSAARKANMQGKSLFPLLAKTYRVAQRYPGGIPQAVYNKSRLAVGSQAAPAQDYDLFNRLAKRAAIAKAKLLGTNPTNKDFEIALATVPNPEMRLGNVRELMGLDYEQGAREYFENAMKQRWAAQNGGLNGRNKQGQSFPEFLSQAMRRPEVQTQTTAPWNRKGGKPKGGGRLVRGADGVMEWHP